MEFHSPWALVLLIIVPIMIYLRMRRSYSASVKFSSIAKMKSCSRSWRIRLRPILFIARIGCVVLLIVALSRPRKGTSLSKVSTEGVVMEVVVDRSSSMQAEMNYYGQKVNRLEAAKRVLADFINGDKDKGFSGRDNDFVGLITFARYADTVCPVVLTHNVLLEFLKQTELVKVRNEDGTAIGDAIALAAARLHTAEKEIEKRKMKLSNGGDLQSEDDEDSGF